MTLVLPGDLVHIPDTDKEIILGPGLRKDNDKVIVMKCGILKQKDNHLFWVDGYQKRYVPVRNEHVIGIIVTKTMDLIKVDIGSNEYASLSFLAFENATKRNRPNVDIGDVLYCKILTGDKDVEPELVCIDSDGKAHGKGRLENGFIFRVNLDLARRLLSTNSTFLSLLGKEFKFEIAIGCNGIIWIKSNNIKETIFLVNFIQRYANIKESDTEEFLKKFIKSEYENFGVDNNNAME